MSDEKRQRQRQQLWIGVYSKLRTEVSARDAADAAGMAVSQFDKAFPAPAAPRRKGCTKCQCGQCVRAAAAQLEGMAAFPGRGLRLY